MYYFMNKDTVLVEFEIDTSKDAFGSEKDFIRNKGVHILKLYEDVKKYPWVDLENFGAFLTRRLATIGKRHMPFLFCDYNLRSLSSFLRMSHGLSLNDAFWVREENEDLGWSDVSLYRNPFDVDVANTSLYGYPVKEREPKPTLSPEFTTQGLCAKCWVRENDSISMVKIPYHPFGAYSECYSSRIVKELGIPHVDYEIRSISNTEGKSLATVCPIFTSEDVGYVPFHDLERNVRSINDIYKRCSQRGYQKEVSEMFVVDAITGNVGRDVKDFGFLFDTNTGELLQFAPLYNFDKTLFSDREVLLENGRVKLEGHKLSHYITFYALAQELITPELAQRLKWLKDFVPIAPLESISEERVENLRKFVESEINLILDI